MRMHFGVRAIDHQPFHIGIADQRGQNVSPVSFVAPPAETSMHILPIAIVRRQIAPWRASTQDPKHGVHEKPVVVGNSAPLPFLSRQQRLQIAPHTI